MAQAPKILPIYEQIGRRLEQRIERGDFVPGQKIPSIRELCDEFDVADKTVKQALQVLGQKRLIRTVAGVGAYVAEPVAAAADAPGAPVAFLKLGATPHAIFLYEIDLVQQALQRLEIDMTYVSAPDEAALAAVVDRMAANPPRCLLVFPSHGPTSEALPARLRAVDVPTLLVESRSRDCSYVTADLEAMTAELTGHLYELGHRHIWLGTDFARKVEGFRRAVERIGDPALQTRVVDLDAVAEARVLAEAVAEASPRPTAVICANDVTGDLFVHHLAVAGLRVPQDVSVAAFDDLPGERGLPRTNLTVARHPCREIAEEAAAWVQGRLAGSEPGRVVRRDIAGALVVRDTTENA